MAQTQDVSSHVASALTAAVKQLDEQVADIGAQALREKHFQAALHSSFALPDGWRAVKEHTLDLPDWPGILGGADIAVLDEDTSVKIAIELKWCREKEKFEETLWDLYKMALAAPTIGGAFLAYAAPSTVWASSPKCSELFATDEWNSAELFHVYKSQWKWLLTGNSTAYPIRFPARIRTTLLCVEGFGAPDARWELRAVQVVPCGQGSLRFDDDRWPACPECGSQKLRPVVFGLPLPELEAETASGDVVLGGCRCWGDERDPAWACLRCGLFGGSSEVEDVPKLGEQIQVVEEAQGEEMNRYTAVIVGEDGSNRVIRGIEAATPDDAVLIVSTIENLDLSELEQPDTQGGAT